MYKLVFFLFFNQNQFILLFDLQYKNHPLSIFLLSRFVFFSFFFFLKHSHETLETCDPDTAKVGFQLKVNHSILLMENVLRSFTIKIMHPEELTFLYSPFSLFFFFCLNDAIAYSWHYLH